MYSIKQVCSGTVFCMNNHFVLTQWKLHSDVHRHQNVQLPFKDSQIMNHVIPQITTNQPACFHWGKWLWITVYCGLNPTTTSVKRSLSTTSNRQGAELCLLSFTRCSPHLHMAWSNNRIYQASRNFLEQPRVGKCHLLTAYVQLPLMSVGLCMGKMRSGCVVLLYVPCGITLN